MNYLRTFVLATITASGLIWVATAGAQGTPTPAPGAGTPPATAPAATPPRGGRRRGPAAPTDAHTAMEDMDRVWLAVKADAVDPARIEQNIRNISSLIRDAAIAKNTVPAEVTKKTGEERVKLAETYRVMLNNLIKAFIELEDAVQAKKVDEIKKLLGEIDEIHKVGHEDFKIDK